MATDHVLFSYPELTICKQEATRQQAQQRPASIELHLKRVGLRAQRVPHFAEVGAVSGAWRNVIVRDQNPAAVHLDDRALCTEDRQETSSASAGCVVAADGRAATAARNARDRAPRR